MQRRPRPRTIPNALLPGLLFLPLAAHAVEEPAYTLSSNVGFFSQYVFRGISYSQEEPAVQGGFDFGHASGLYLGVWGTSLSSTAINDAAGEIDVYGGYAGSVGDFGYDLGFLQFIFPGGEIADTGESYNTLELYAGVTWRFLNLKYSHAVTDYFGFNDKSMGMGRGDSDGSYYVEANANFEFLPSWTLGLHAGRQKVRNYDEYSFTDYKVGVAKDFEGGWQIALAWIDTTARSSLYTLCNSRGRDCVDTGDSKWLASIKRTF